MKRVFIFISLFLCVFLVSQVRGDFESGLVDDTAYDATTWNGVTGVAPSKNAVRDKIEALGVPTSVTVADTTDTTAYVGLFESATGNLGPKTDAGITYNAGTGVLTATGFYGPLTGAVTGNSSTATALAANGANCTAGNYPLGVDASGAVESCTALTTVATDTIFDAAGDIVQGTGANTSARLAIGTAGQMLKVNSGATALEYTSTISIDTVSPTTLNLPSSNADPATTAGQIRHDSTDTDASAGGIIEWWDGTNTRRVVDIAASAAANYTVVTKTEYLPIRYAEDGTTGPAAAAEISTTTAIGRGFDKDADEDVVFWWVAPLDYVGGIKYRVIYALAADATADDTAVFSLAGCAAANSATLACTPGDAVTLADELTTDDDQFQVMISDYSTEVTVTNIAAGSLNRLVFLRDVSEDDYTEGDLLVIGIEIKYKARINGVDAY